MKKIHRLGLLTMLLGVAGLANGQATLIDQGPGWQRFSEPLPQDAASKARSTLSAEGGDPAVRELVLISSQAGVNDAPLSQALKDLLAQEFQSSGVASADGAPLEDPIVVDLKLAEAVANGAELSDYSAYVEPDDSASGAGTQFFGCYTGWRDGSFKVIDRSLDQVGWDSNDRDESNFMLSGRLNLSGRATVTIGYQWKKSSFCIPWIARFRHAHVQGFVSVDDSNMEVNWSWSDTLDERHELFKLFDVSTTVMIGPVPVRFGAQMPIGWGFSMTTSYDLSAQMTFPFSGVKRFDYLCTLRDRCQSQLDPNDPNNTTLEFGASNDLTGSTGASGSITVKPYVYLEALGYLYDPRVAHVGIGVEAGLPLTLWGTHDDCGAGTGDATDNVQGNFMDLNAELGLYFTYNLVGVADTLGLDWDFGVYFLDFWKVFETEDVIRKKGPIKVLRKNLLFSRWNENAGVSPFTPVVTTDGDAGVGIAESISMRLRSCVPLKDAVTYRVEWSDGATKEVHEPTQSSTGHRAGLAQVNLTWNTSGAKIVKVTPIRDAAGRDLTVMNSGGPKPATTERTVNVSAYVAPPTPASITLSKSGSSLKVTWSATSNTTKYKLDREYNGVWTFATTVNAPTVEYTQSSPNIGTYRYRVRACNNNGGVERCSSSKTSASVVVGTPPSPPSSVSNVSALCKGLSTVKWSAVSGATSYRLYANTLNSPGTATQVYSGTALSQQVNPPSATYYWVKACNAVGCSTFSAYTRTQFYPVCM